MGKPIKTPDYSYLIGRDPLYVLNKKRSPDVIEYIVDEDDDWFIYVTTKSRKSGEIKHVSMIIRKDMPNWLSYAQSQGWEAKKMYEEILKEE
jgi:hypothetical protein